MGLTAISRPDGKALNVAVHFIKFRARDVQRTERSVQVKSRNRCGVHCIPIRLRQDKPISAKPESGTRCFFALFLLLVILRNALLVLHRHAKGDALFAFAHLAFEFQPTAIGIEWSRLQVTAAALRQSEQGIPKRVVMESGVSGQQFSRRVDRAVKQFCPSFMIVVYSSLSFLLFPFSSGFAARKRSKFPS